MPKVNQLIKITSLKRYDFKKIKQQECKMNIIDNTAQTITAWWSLVNDKIPIDEFEKTKMTLLKYRTLNI